MGGAGRAKTGMSVRDSDIPGDVPIGGRCGNDQLRLHSSPLAIEVGPQFIVGVGVFARTLSPPGRSLPGNGTAEGGFCRRCNFASVALMFNIIGGVSVCFYDASPADLASGQNRGHRFQKVLIDFFPWPAGITARDGAEVLYKYARHPSRTRSVSTSRAYPTSA